MEFEDRRAYAAGDDVRHLDWRAYARTDQLMIRLHREEIAPRVELILDDSASMGHDTAKGQLALDLALLIASAARAGGHQVALLVASEALRPVPLDHFLAEGLPLAAKRPLADTLSGAAPALRAGAVRLLVSDFLSPLDPSRLVRDLALGAGALGLIQVLGTEDVEPPLGEALRLTDAETGETLDLVLDEPTVEAYRARLERLEAGLAEEARRARGAFARVVADGRDLNELGAETLAPAGLLEPA